ncbi:MAG: RNA-binding protein [bacterium]|nr:RNA-binding protein [bacterium]
MNIYVGNLSRETTEDELKQAFGQYGQVGSVSIIKDRLTGEPRGFGFIEMTAKEEAENAIRSLNGQDLKGRNLTVNEARPRNDRNDRGGRSNFGNERRY